MTIIVQQCHFVVTQSQTPALTRYFAALPHQLAADGASLAAHTTAASARPPTSTTARKCAHTVAAAYSLAHDARIKGLLITARCAAGSGWTAGTTWITTRWTVRTRVGSQPEAAAVAKKLLHRATLRQRLRSSTSGSPLLLQRQRMVAIATWISPAPARLSLMQV